MLFMRLRWFAPGCIWKDWLFAKTKKCFVT